MEEIRQLEERDNQKESIQLRKYQEILMITGAGVLLFSVWSFIRFFIAYAFYPEDLMDYYQIDASDIEGKRYLLIVTCTALVIDLLFHWYIGRRAIAEGRGRKSGVLYLFMAAFLCLSSVLNIEAVLSDADIFYAGGADRITTAIIEMTSLAIFLEMIHAAIRLKISRKALRRQMACAEADGQQST